VFDQVKAIRMVTCGSLMERHHDNHADVTADQSQQHSPTNEHSKSSARKVGSTAQGTKVCRYNWHSAGSLGWPFPTLKYKYVFSNRIYRSDFIEQHSETYTV